MVRMTALRKNSDGIKTYNVDENNQNNKEIKSGSPVKNPVIFETRKTIAALMIIQFISIIVIIFMAGKKEKEEQ